MVWVSPKTTIDDLGIDLLQNIVSRLPALSFASVGCVSRSWNNACSSVLCRPKLSSACSFESTLQVAVQDVVNKVLSEPIRPHFAIASIGPRFKLQETLQLIAAKLSTKVPLVIDYSLGIVVKNVVSNASKETWYPDALLTSSSGIMLTVGFVPGLKVKPISLLRQIKDPRTLMIDQFVTDIWEFSTSVSGHQSPAAIMISGVPQADMDAVMKKMDYAMAPETVILGGCNLDAADEESVVAVALVFVEDSKKPPGIGETKFHALLSSVLSPVGPSYKVDCVIEYRGDHDYLHGKVLTGHIEGEGPFETIDKQECTWIGITKRRMRSIRQEDAKWTTSLSFHNVVYHYRESGNCAIGANVDVERGDTYRYYNEDPNTSQSTVDYVSNFMRSLKQRSTNSSDKWDGSSGLIFTCFSRGVSFLSKPNDADNSTFLELQEHNSTRACMNGCSGIYLIVSYTQKT
ncbi:hypothetical protein QVD17_02525 [Tagetes erecta]|uniref:F-box domain-containing protein n=1 Tax=Tagetes erecta TaxID=13708 RepID=A0AAD8P7U9_TARER|nr:hypothetical protein QVD17_02525 [Tagetes erecta]